MVGDIIPHTVFIWVVHRQCACGRCMVLFVYIAIYIYYELYLL